MSTYATAAVRSALHDGILVPSLWAYEIENALLIIHRRKRITDTELDDAFAELATWSVRSQPPYGFGVSARIAANTGLTSYDASYLSVALNSGSRLATLDRKLRDAARNLGARLFEDESDKP